MTKDKGDGEGTKPSLEATGVSEIQNDTVRARETEAKDISPHRSDKREASFPSAKIRSRCRSHQIFGATKLGFLPMLRVTCAQMWRQAKADQEN